MTLYSASCYNWKFEKRNNEQKLLRNILLGTKVNGKMSGGNDSWCKITTKFKITKCVANKMDLFIYITQLIVR